MALDEAIQDTVAAQEVQGPTVQELPAGQEHTEVALAEVPEATNLVQEQHPEVADIADLDRTVQEVGATALHHQEVQEVAAIGLHHREVQEVLAAIAVAPVVPEVQEALEAQVVGALPADARQVEEVVAGETKSKNQLTK